MPLAADAMLGMAMRFDVTIDEVNLGSWATCTGLSVDFAPVEVKELGVNENSQWIPGPVHYPNVTLTRAMTKEDSQKVFEWLSAQVQKNNGGSSAGELIGGAAAAAFGGAIVALTGGSGSKPAGTAHATITLRDAKYGEVFTWTLRNVFPKSWKGPSLDGSTNKVAIETLELVHEGFLR